MNNSGQSEMFPVSRSNLYQLWWEEREHISKNRWYLSEKAGHDVGHDFAAHNWTMCHRGHWISELKETGKYPQ